MCLERVLYVDNSVPHCPPRYPTTPPATDIEDIDKIYTSGYKIFYKMKNGHLRGEYLTEHMTRPYNKWLHEEDFRVQLWGLPKLEAGFEADSVQNFLTGRDGQYYPKGWHVYVFDDSPNEIKSNPARLTDEIMCNKAHTVRQVEMKDIVAVGKQYLYVNSHNDDMYKTMVAEMLVLVYVCKQIKILKPE